MKIRNGFVSNSSSSSFVVCFKSVDDVVEANKDTVVELVYTTMLEEGVKFGTKLDIEFIEENGLTEDDKTDLLNVAKIILNNGTEFYPSGVDDTLGYNLLDAMSNKIVLISSQDVSSDSGTGSYILKDDLIKMVEDL